MSTNEDSAPKPKPTTPPTPVQAASEGALSLKDPWETMARIVDQKGIDQQLAIWLDSELSLLENDFAPFVTRRSSNRELFGSSRSSNKPTHTIE